MLEARAKADGAAEADEPGERGEIQKRRSKRLK